MAHQHHGAETVVQGTRPRANSEMNITPLINKQEVTLQELDARFKEVYENRRDKTMFIMAVGSLRYGDIVRVIDSAKGAGVDRVGIVTERMRGTIPR